MRQIRNRTVRILAVDDSAVMRGVLRTLFRAGRPRGAAGQVEIELCAVVDDGMACLEAVERLHPDLVLLDIEMPRMHGLDVLARLRQSHPGLPVLMCSAYTEEGGRLALEALGLGARDFVTKPAEQDGITSALEALAADLLPKVHALMHRSSTEDWARAEAARAVEPHQHPAAARPEVVVVGASTGGPMALECVLRDLPGSFPVPILIAQHMPRLFTGALAERLQRGCALKVREARDGTALEPGNVWLAPGGTHIEIRGDHPGTDMERKTRPILCVCGEGEPACFRPSVDRLFHSAALVYGARTLALVMTGMGADGLSGARAVHEVGGTVLAQNQASSAVWGMPGRVWEAGLVRAPLPLEEIASELITRVSGQSSRTPRFPARSTSGSSVPRARTGGVNAVL